MIFAQLPVDDRFYIKFCANTLHSETMRATGCSLSPEGLQIGDMFTLLIMYLIVLVLVASSRAAMIELNV